jgi:hypothetical protein
MEKVGPLPGAREDVLVFVFREWLSRNPVVQRRVFMELEAQGLVRVHLAELEPAEAERARARIRGGNWVETGESREGGGPSAFAVFLDPTPAPPGARDRLLRPFCRNAKLGAKTELKQVVARECNGGRVVNFLHAADDEREAFEYLACLDPERHARALEAIARVRRIAARRGR